jgi:hypothetical protein
MDEAPRDYPRCTCRRNCARIGRRPLPSNWVGSVCSRTCAIAVILLDYCSALSFASECLRSLGFDFTPDDGSVRPRNDRQS